MSTAVGLPSESVMSLVELGTHLPLSEGRLREMCRQGAIPASKVGRQFFVFPSDIRNSSLGALWR